MTELERAQGVVIANLLSGAQQKGQPLGYTPPNPLATITVSDTRIGDGGGSSTYWSFQATLQRRVQQLAGSFAFRSTATPELVSALLGQSADDAVAYLGDADPDCANRDALLQTYIQLYNLATTVY